MIKLNVKNQKTLWREYRSIIKRMEINPDNLFALYCRGNAYCAKGDYDKAIEDFTAVRKRKAEKE